MRAHVVAHVHVLLEGLAAHAAHEAALRLRHWSGPSGGTALCCRLGQMVQARHSATVLRVGCHCCAIIAHQRRRLFAAVLCLLLLLAASLLPGRTGC